MSFSPSGAWSRTLTPAMLVLPSTSVVRARSTQPSFSLLRRLLVVLRPGVHHRVGVGVHGQLCLTVSAHRGRTTLAGPAPRRQPRRVPVMAAVEVVLVVHDRRGCVAHVAVGRFLTAKVVDPAGTLSLQSNNRRLNAFGRLERSYGVIVDVIAVAQNRFAIRQSTRGARRRCTPGHAQNVCDHSGRELSR